MGSSDLVGGERRQQAEELVGVVVDRLDALVGEQVGEGPLRHQAVLEQVADPRRHPQVVLEHVDGAVVVADQVAAADVGPHAVAGADAHGTRAGSWPASASSSAGNTPSATTCCSLYTSSMNWLRACEPLDQPRLDAAPLGGVDDPGDHVERPRPVDAAPVGVDGERDAHGEHVEVGGVLTGLQLGHPEVLEVLDERRGRPARAAVGLQQLVPQRRPCRCRPGPAWRCGRRVTCGEVSASTCVLAVRRV